MNKYTGKSVFGGIAIGKIMVYEKGEHQVKRVKITDAEAEKNRYYEAVEIAFKQLGELHDKALREVGEANAAIFEIHQMMLEDDDYRESIEKSSRCQRYYRKTVRNTFWQYRKRCRCRRACYYGGRGSGTIRDSPDG